MAGSVTWKLSERIRSARSAYDSSLIFSSLFNSVAAQEFSDFSLFSVKFSLATEYRICDIYREYRTRKEPSTIT